MKMEVQERLGGKAGMNECRTDRMNYCYELTTVRTSIHRYREIIKKLWYHPPVPIRDQNHKQQKSHKTQLGSIRSTNMVLKYSCR